VIRSRFLVLAAILVTSVSLRVGAQTQTNEPRLLLGAGVAQGSGWPTCDNCTGIDHRQGLTGYVRAGAFLTPKVALSVEADRWVNNASDANSQFQSVLAVGQVYAQNHEGLSLKVGAGVGGSLIRYQQGGGDISSTGFAYTVGLGYDFPLAARLAVTAFGDFLGTAAAPEHYSLARVTGSLDGNVMRLGIGLTWR
jgi:opacity protein-like surface antigen